MSGLGRGGGGGSYDISSRLNAIKYHLKLQPFAMTLYKSHNHYCSGKEYVTNFEIRLGSDLLR